MRDFLLHLVNGGGPEPVLRDGVEAEDVLRQACCMVHPPEGAQFRVPERLGDDRCAGRQPVERRGKLARLIRQRRRISTEGAPPATPDGRLDSPPDLRGERVMRSSTAR